MAQFSVYLNINPNSCDAYPYLMDVQNDLLDTLGTRVVIPIARHSRLINTPIERLTPILPIEEAPHVLLTPNLPQYPLPNWETLSSTSVSSEPPLSALWIFSLQGIEGSASVLQTCNGHHVNKETLGTRLKPITADHGRSP